MCIQTNHVFTFMPMYASPMVSLHVCNVMLCMYMKSYILLSSAKACETTGAKLFCCFAIFLCAFDFRGRPGSEIKLIPSFYLLLLFVKRYEVTDIFLHLHDCKALPPPLSTCCGAIVAFSFMNYLQLTEIPTVVGISHYE